jgi:hypothetical protein
LRDVVEGVRGAARMAFGLATPFLSRPRRRWGLDASAAARALPGDELVANPRWSWTHGIEIGAPAGDVWPWVAQIGADRGGFYSYQWLENLAGCRIRNAETIHPEWELREGGSLRLHPSVPALRIAALERGRYFVAAATVGPADWKAARPWVAVSWLLLVEPLGPARCRLLSRYRAASSTDLGTRLSAGPALLEPIGGEMDRRMLLGIKARAERAWPAHAA